MFDDIAPNADAFARQLNAIADNVENDIFDKVIRKALFDLLQEIIKNTPIDTGRARASWVLDIEFSDFSLPPGDYNSVFEKAIPETMAWLPHSDHYVLYNNLEYIVALENGHSKQRPNGFVAQALAAFASHLSKVAKAAGYNSVG